MSLRTTSFLMTGTVLLVCLSQAFAETPYQVAWARQIGTSSEDRSNSVALDASGNAYITGYTSGSLGGTNAGWSDAFLTKFDAMGTVLWSRQIGTSNVDESHSVAVDAFGNAYISGETKGNIGGINAGGVDAFLTKYDTTGTKLWSRQIGTIYYDTSSSVAVDASGNAYISGKTGGSLGGTNAGVYDAFLTKYDAAGTELWSRQIGTSDDDGSSSVAVDASGNIYISGSTRGKLGGVNNGITDAFLTKYDATGTVLWSRQIGTAYADSSQSVAVDASGNAYISGYTKGNLGGTNAGDYDAFLTKYDAAGNQLWSRQIGTAEYDYSYSITVDASGNAYISGNTGGNLGGTNAGGYYDAFLTKYDAMGTLLWSRQIGTSDDDGSSSIAVDASGGVYISGSTYGSLGGTNAGSSDAFLVKFEAPEPTSAVLLSLGALAFIRRRVTPHPQSQPTAQRHQTAKIKFPSLACTFCGKCHGLGRGIF